MTRSASDEPEEVQAPPNLAGRAARGGAITLVSQMIKLTILLGSTIVVSRLLSPSDYGLLAMAMAIIGVSEIFRDFGLSMAALSAKNLTHAQQSNLFWINAGSGTILGVLVFAASWPIAAFYGSPELVGIVQCLSLVYVLGGLSTQFRVSINRDLRFVALSVIDIAPLVVGLAVAIGAALSGYGYWALVAQQIVMALLSLLLAVFLARWRPGRPRRNANMRHLLTFGGNFAASQLLSYLTRNIDSVAIGRVWGASTLGSYDRAYQLVTLPLTQINTPLSRVAVPVLTRISDDRDRFLTYLRKAQLVACYVTTTVFLIVAAIGDHLVLLLLGPTWEFSGTIIRVLAVAGIFRSISQISYWMFMSQGLAGAQLRFFAVAQPVVILTTLAGLPWGAVGVAVGSTIGYAIFWLASLYWAGRKSKLNVTPLIVGPIRCVALFGAPGALVAWAVASAVPFTSEFVLVALGTLAAAAWFALAIVLFKPVREDASVLVSYAKAARRGA